MKVFIRTRLMNVYLLFQHMLAIMVKVFVQFVRVLGKNLQAMRPNFASKRPLEKLFRLAKTLFNLMKNKHSTIKAS